MFILGLVLGTVGGFVLGVMLGRTNKKAVEAAVLRVKELEAKVNNR